MATLLSVMMPVYNGAAYLADAIDSVLQQRFKDFEFLIMDDGSVDGSQIILERYAARDGRIRVFLRPHQGQIACRNELLQLAKADMVACADADDVCLPNRFEHQFCAMSQDRDLWVLGTAMTSIDSTGKQHRRRRVTAGCAQVSAQLEKGCCIGHPSVMMRRPQILRIGAYRPAYQSAEDYDLFLRASERGKVDNLDMVGVLYRVHEASESHRQSVRQAISADLARATHFLRIAGHPDPTDGLPGPPPLEDKMLAALIPPAEMELHRAMAITFNINASVEEIEQALRYFLHARIGSKQARACQSAMVRLISRRNLDRLSVGAAARAAALGPGRLVRLLWKMRQRGASSG